MSRKVNCYIGVGSNLGDRYSFIKQAIGLVSERIGKLTAKSFVYESAAWGTYEGETFPYLNAALLVATRCSPYQVIDLLQVIEQVLGRTRTTVNAPRNIDLDLLYYGNEVIETERLFVPHPRLASRRFVLEPLNDIYPNFIHPLLGLSNQQLLEKCPDPQQALTRV